MNFGAPSEAATHDDIPEGFANLSETSRKHVQLVIDAHRLYLQDGDLIPPTFIIERNKSVVFLPVDGSSQQAKDYSAETARKVASMSNSEFVAFVSMVWVLPESQFQNSISILAKYGSIKKYPGSLQRAFVNLETRTCRYCALIPVLPCPPSKMRKKLGAVVWERTEGSGGTFDAILPLDSAH
jgi:hypothetical protein